MKPSTSIQSVGTSQFIEDKKSLLKKSLATVIFKQIKNQEESSQLATNGLLDIVEQLLDHDNDDLREIDDKKYSDFDQCYQITLWTLSQIGEATQDQLPLITFNPTEFVNSGAFHYEHEGLGNLKNNIRRLVNFEQFSQQFINHNQI